jgi:hypothetical protein
MKQYTVSIQIGLNTTFEFEAADLGCEAVNALALGRIDDNGNHMTTKSFLFINFGTSKVSFSYDIFFLDLDILQKKEVDGDYHIKCVNDLFRVDIYVCDSEKWAEDGEEIFIS